MKEALLVMKDIIKDFPGVRALDHVNFEAHKGEVLVLAGENGAGKSTLMKVLSGVWAYPSYEGDIVIDGKLRQFRNTKEAEENGVAIIHQELNLIPEMSVAENIYLGKQPMKGARIDWNRIFQDASSILKRLGLDDIDVMIKIKELTVGKQQMVEIAKALAQDADILVFDEPTSALTNKEVDELFRVIMDLKREGKCIIYISHKMEEFERIGDRVAVLRDGQTIGKAVRIKDTSIDEIISKMVGRDITDMFPKVDHKIGEVIMEVKDFHVNHPFIVGEKKVKDVSFVLKKGEILGIAGLMGAGRSELVTGIFGALGDDAKGRVYLNGREVKVDSPEKAIREGLALVTEDRKLLGLFLDKDLTFNSTTLSRTLEESSSKLGVLDHLHGRQLTRDIVKDLNVKTPSIDVDVGNLSGGNQQKVIIGKWLASKPKVLILDEPTRGIDVGAKVEIYKLINKLVLDGVSIIMISSELPEIMGMSDRVLVMCEGELVANLDKVEASKERIMAFATGNYREDSNEESIEK